MSAAYYYKQHNNINTSILEQSASYFLDMEMPFASTQEDHHGRMVASASACFNNPYYYFSSDHQSLNDGSTLTDTTRTNDITSSLDSNHSGAKADRNSSVATPENRSRDPSIESKGKSEDDCLVPSQSKDANGNRRRCRKQKQVNSDGVSKQTEKKKKQPKDEEEKKRKSPLSDQQEPPAGYIHVRARRGQATDSHSLAERVRREKISMRMKVLQGLVPGCDKVVGKALMLDEIINYVQSLQNQVEFLSMRLASVNPFLCDFGVVDLDDFINHAQEQQQMLSANTYPIIDTSTSLPLHCQGTSTAFSQANNSSNIQMQQLCNGLNNNNNNTRSYFWQ